MIVAPYHVGIVCVGAVDASNYGGPHKYQHCISFLWRIIVKYYLFLLADARYSRVTGIDYCEPLG